MRTIKRDLTGTLLALALALAAGCGGDDGPAAEGAACTANEACASAVCGGGVCLAADGDDDGDGLTNLAEALIGSDPTKADTDGDGVDDGVEHGPGATPVDTDGDGLPDLLESAAADADADCIPDQFDRRDDQVDLDLSVMRPLICRDAGVCALDPNLMTVRCGVGAVPTCDYSDVPNFEADETRCDDRDNDCDGATDEGHEDDADCDGVPADDDCDDDDPDSTVKADDADCDGVPTADDCDDDDDGSTIKANDADCDGVPTDDDCDDDNPNSTIKANDADCDGVLTDDDCDDDNPNSTVKADDADCDGVLAADDCDDDDDGSTVKANDADCDGVPTDDDCDDDNPNSTVKANDADCDGVLAADDCDDDDENSTVKADDADCDGVLTADDCDDNDQNSTIKAEDADCDGVLTADDCDDNDQNSTIKAEDADCDGVLAAADCDDNDQNSTVKAEDADCDGILTADDCDDNHAGSTRRADDADCDGVLSHLDCDDDDDTVGGPGPLGCDLDGDGTPADEDCDDDDEDSTIKAEDADCDGVLTADDCDDLDPLSPAIALDGDCDGVPTELDCDDADPLVGSRIGDADCDGVPAECDCDDDDPTSPTRAEDADCDGLPNDLDDDDDDDTIPDAEDPDADGDDVPRAEDCDDSDPCSTIRAEDADCDGVPDALDCDVLNPIPCTPPATIFVTGATFTGDLGGFAGADAVCQAEASATGSTARYQAWLGAGATSPLTRAVRYDGDYARVDGVRVANGFDDLLDGALEAPLDRTLSNVRYVGDVWSGVVADGAVTPDGTCEAWTCGELACDGRFGSSTAMDGGWSDAHGGACGDERALYCVQQVSGGPIGLACHDSTVGAADCTEAGCACVGCNDDGSCGLDDDCVCGDCASDGYCGSDTCRPADGLCDVYVEGCACADCAYHPSCLGFAIPEGHAVLTFTVDDRANRTYAAPDGLAWKGSFGFDAAARTVTHDASWGGPFALLYDDGPFDQGGHEPLGARAGDHIWSVAVWAPIPSAGAGDTIYRYGAIRGSVGGSDGHWIWPGEDGTLVLPTTAQPGQVFEAPGLVLPERPPMDLMFTLDLGPDGDAAKLHPDFAGVTYGGVVINGDAWGGAFYAMVDDGTQGDAVAGDHVYTFVMSTHVSIHDGLTAVGQEAYWFLLLDGARYRVGDRDAIDGLRAFSRRAGTDDAWERETIRWEIPGGGDPYVLVGASDERLDCGGQAACGASTFRRVGGAAVTWQVADAQAQLSWFSGGYGHLAVPSDGAESDLLRTIRQLPEVMGELWIGGYQDTGAADYSEPAGGWRWVTGEPFVPFNWADNEPNNAATGENCIELWGTGQWADARASNPSFNRGYVVELPAPDAAPWYNPDNGHYYARVDGAYWDWADADALANALWFGGARGHLATITSAEEQAFISASFGDDHLWLGGFQDVAAGDYAEPGGGWRWVTGEPFSYTNWAPGEPNDAGGEEFLMLTPAGDWNDDAQASGLTTPVGLLVEFAP